MPKTAVIIPYFGKFPNYFNLWAESVKYNPEIDVFLFTDNKCNCDLPSNIHLINTTFDDLKKDIQKNFDFSIKLDAPYKLCDYRPVYGLIFQNYIKEYSYWGYGDIDTIWGNMDYIIKKELDGYDKLLDLGHFTLYKNSDKMNHLWQQKIPNSWNSFDAFRSPLEYHFDEGGGIAPISKKLGCRLYTELPGQMNFADIIPFRDDFEIAYDNSEGKTPHIFSWKKGVLTGYWVQDDQIKHREYSYLHLQKRNMVIFVDRKDIKEGYWIVPNKFLPLTSKKISNDFIVKTRNSLVNKPSDRNIIMQIRNFIKFRIEGRVRGIPLNGNEVYFGTEKARF